MGASGDMIMSALLDLYGQPQEFTDFMNGLGIPGIRLVQEETKKCGVRGLSVHVLVNGVEELCGDAVPSESTGHAPEEHIHHGAHHSKNLEDILSLIESLALSEQVKADAVQIYRSIAQAESEVHGQPVGEIHFHEVGSMDAIADIVGCCQLMSLLKPDVVTASAVNVGSGEIHCAHGILPVPAPATAILLRGVPIYAGEVKSELCTPTGAALLKHFVSSFGPMPVLRIDKTGYGMGQKDFTVANCLRAFLGENDVQAEDVVEISCNLDDMTGEAIGFTVGRLMEAGALDTFVTPIIMKKGRPAQILTCLCRPQQEQFFTHMILSETTTFGVRTKTCRRTVLTTEIRPIKTQYGEIRWKTGSGYGIKKGKPEFEDVQKTANANQVPFDLVWQSAEFTARSMTDNMEK